MVHVHSTSEEFSLDFETSSGPRCARFETIALPQQSQ
jgi:hypothetical protein